MSFLARLIIGLILCEFVITGMTWNFTGHIIIAQIAYDQLTPATKQKANALAALIYFQLPARQKAKLEKYHNASTFAKVAALPDRWRLWHLDTLFRKFHAPLPLNLYTESKDNTASWHFINLPYPNNEGCHITEPMNVLWSIRHLEVDVQSPPCLNTEALTMVLLEHMVGDAHEPLHVISHINSFCQSDRGGNEDCLRYSNHDRCRLSLHQLWDSGVGEFRSPPQNIEATAHEIEEEYPVKTWYSEAEDLNPSDWVSEEYQLASFIYSTPSNCIPNAHYYHEGQEIAKKQMALAGYRLAEMLNRLL